MILVWLILMPFLAGLLCWPAERWHRHAPGAIALATLALMLVIILGLWGSVPATPSGWWLDWRLSWIPRFGIAFHLALDGLSLVLVALTVLLGVLSVLCSWREIDARPGLFHLGLMWTLAGVVGVFLAIDLFLFFLFWEAMLVPMYFLIALWGHSSATGLSRIGAATKFFIYTQVSGLIMLVAILGLVLAHQATSGEYSFSYTVLSEAVIDDGMAWWLMLGFFVAFAVKLPAVPLHGWLPDAHSQAPTAGSVLLAGILLKTGAYGLLRFVLPLFPQASMAFAPVAMGLGLLGIVYGAVLACGQRDIKRLIAYTSISHMGFVLIGAYAGSELALQGVVVLLVAHALSSAGLFILSGQLKERLHTLDMQDMGGLWGRLPRLPAFTLCFVVASLGMPGTANFVGEFMILFGSFPAAPWVVALATGGLVLAAVYALRLMQGVHFGPAKAEGRLAGPDRREAGMMLALLVLVVGLGLYPGPLLETSAGAMAAVVTQWMPVSLGGP